MLLIIHVFIVYNKRWKYNKWFGLHYDVTA